MHLPAHSEMVVIAWGCIVVLTHILLCLFPVGGGLPLDCEPPGKGDAAVPRGSGLDGWDLR